MFFGAIEHGLDYVALGCQTLFGPGTDVLGVIARNGVDIKLPADFVGKRIAVPGVNGGTPSYRAACSSVYRSPVAWRRSPRSC